MEACVEVDAVVGVCVAEAYVEEFLLDAGVFDVLFGAHPSVGEVGVEGEVFCEFYVAVCGDGYFWDCGCVLAVYFGADGEEAVDEAEGFGFAAEGEFELFVGQAGVGVGPDDVFG